MYAGPPPPPPLLNVQYVACDKSFDVDDDDAAPVNMSQK